MAFYLEVRDASHIKRDEDGVAWHWQLKPKGKDGGQIRKFYSPEEFEAYVNKNGDKLIDRVAVTESASLLVEANMVIANKLKEKGLL